MADWIWGLIVAFVGIIVYCIGFYRGEQHAAGAYSYPYQPCGRCRALGKQIEVLNGKLAVKKKIIKALQDSIRQRTSPAEPQEGAE